MVHSRGASMAILAGLTNPYITSFASVFSSFTEDGYNVDSDIAKWKAQGYLLKKRDLPPGGGPSVKEFKLPYGFYEDQLQYAVAKDLKQSEKPKLFILGKRDVLAVPEIVKKLYSITSDPKELYELDSDHNYRFHPKFIEEVNKVVGAFLHKYNQL